MSNSNILLLVSGSIAAYKACYLVSKLVQRGHAVKVVASKSALQFVSAATFEALSHQAVAHDLFEAGHSLEHISLMRWADLIIAAPATAHLINRMAYGIGDDLLTTLYLAHDFTKPFLVAPAMNTKMYRHPATQRALKTLRAQGVEILETASGVLACGEEGWGKLLDPDLIAADIEIALNHTTDRPLPGPSHEPRLTPRPHILITSGGCVEAIDQVRVITNTSTGATGAALADHFYQLGCTVSFVSAQKGVRPKGEVDTFTFTDFKSLQEVLQCTLKTRAFDMIIHAAAVSDYSVAGIEASVGDVDRTKLASEAEDITIRLRKNPKLLTQFRTWSQNPNMVLVGFKLSGETDPEAIRAVVARQIEQADCDLVVQNTLQDISHLKGQHRYHLYNKSGQNIADCQGVESLAQALSLRLKPHA